MDSLIRRVTKRYLRASDEEQYLSYEDWAEVNPDLAKTQTISPVLLRSLLRALRLVPQSPAVKFFHLVDRIHHIGLGAPAEDVSNEFRAAAKLLAKAVIGAMGDVRGAEIANNIVDCAVNNVVSLQRIGRGARGPLFATVGADIGNLIEKISRANGLSAGAQLKTTGGVKWPVIRVLSKKDEDLRKLQENNPSLYAEILGNVEQASKFHDQAQKLIVSSGLVPTTVDVDGIPLPAGEDYVSGEKVVYTPDGRVLPERVLRQEILKRRRSEAILMSEFTPMYVMENGVPVPVRRPEDLKIQGLRKMSDEDLTNPELIPPGQKPEFRAMTDDKAASKGTRIYATMRDVDGNPVIVDGRFKGFYLDDMVNANGRLVEGAAYDVDESGLPVSFETLDNDGNLSLDAVNKEPYVTVNSKGQLLVKIPVNKGRRKDPFTQSRERMRALSSKPDKVKKVKNPETGKFEKKITKGRTRGTSIVELLPASEDQTLGVLFTFEPKDFATVRSAVGGMCMSAQAAKLIRDYFAQQARQEDALREERLQSYTLDRIGGFKNIVDPKTGKQRDLMSKQKEALSWIESKGYKGLAALDTGVGKTLLTIATMQKMLRDGAAGDSARFLYVCPGHLKGNLPREMQLWLTQEAITDLMSRVDVMSYETFASKVNGGSRSVTKPVPGTEKLEKILDSDGNPMRGEDGRLLRRPVPGTEKRVTVRGSNGKPLKEKVIPNPDFAKQYAAVFFDEAHVLTKNENSPKSVAAQRLDHPRKVLLTASPMEDSPDELYVGIAITNNTVVASQGRTVSQARKDLMAFRRRFVDRIAGQTMGVKKSDDSDPTRRQDFDAWVKNGMYFADKRTVTEPDKKLPDLLKQQPVSLTMDPEVEIEYRKASNGISKVLRGLVSAYRDKTKPPAAIAREVASYKTLLRRYMKALDQLSNYPDEYLDPTTGEKKFPGKVSSKIAGAAWLVNDKVAMGKRTLMFTDDPKFAVKTAEQVSANLPGKQVAVALSDRVIVFTDGKVRDQKEDVYTRRIYTDKFGNKVPKEQWATVVLGDIIGGNPEVVGLVLTKSYALGQNLQMFNTVVHLDRDNFSNETMKQRTARAWRTGQKEPVEEYTLDAVYDDDKEKDDPTLDDVRRYIQEMQEGVFNDIVHNSRATAIGEDWRSMSEVPASMMAVNRKLFEMAIAPYPAAMAEHDYNQAVRAG